MFRRSQLSLRHLRAMMVTAEEGSINRAASVLRLSQPAITSSIRIIEKQIHVPLFERSSRGVTATPAGGIYAQRAQRAFQHLRNAEQALVTHRKDGHTEFHNAVSFRHLVALIETAECESMTYAAKRIGITQAAVDRSIRELEHLVGNSLLERRHRRMIPTIAGVILIRHAKLAFAELRYAQEELAAHGGVMSGHVAIGCLPLSQTILAPRAIARLSNIYPQIRFSIVDGPYLTLLSSLRCGDLDLIVGALRAPPPVNDVAEEILFKEPLSVIVRHGHPLLQRKADDLHELATWPWVVPRVGTPTRTIFERLFQRIGAPVPTKLFEASSLVAVRALLIESDRLTILSRSQIEYEERAGILSILPIALPETARPIGITTRADMSLSPAIEALIQQLRDISRELYADENVRSKRSLRPQTRQRADLE